MTEDIKTLPNTEIWTPGKPETQNLDPRVEEAIDNAVAEMNSDNPQQTILNLQKHVHMSENGVVSALLYGNKPIEYSGEEALVMFNPFANMATPNMLVRAEFIRRVAEKLDVCAADGKLKPVVMLAAPGPRHALNLSKEERQQVQSGELGPAAK